ncbi:hypothetical protein [Pseudomonas fluorescens]|uniref:hypothetical protein n=1 Tax=Pseudomonas fluorescens TaxID=294 RepID=UPI001CD2C065
MRRPDYAPGYRFRLHRRDLPGKPELVFIVRRATTFAHGCFWRGHNRRRGARKPKTNTGYWHSKIARNRERDSESMVPLEVLGRVPTLFGV